MKVGAIETQWDRIPAVAEYCGIGDFKTIECLQGRHLERRCLMGKNLRYDDLEE